MSVHVAVGPDFKEADAKQMIDIGFQLVTLANDNTLLAQRAKEVVTAMRAGKPGGKAKAAKPAKSKSKAPASPY